MAEDIQTAEIAKTQITNQGFLANVGNSLEKIKKFSNEPAVQRSIPVMITLFVIFIGLVFFISFREPSRTTLFSALPEHEKSRVMDVLRANGIDVSIDRTTGEILVPSPEYYEAKMKLAAEGLPSSVPQGYDVLEKIPMGTSRSVEFMKMKQTQEIELARSINEIANIVGARVHLAIPEKSVFVRDSSPPTASVFVKLADGRALGLEQIRSIVHIVSSSIPNMTSDNVTVVDQYGSLLSKPEDDPNLAMTEKQLAHRVKIESIYRERVLSLVSPIVGAGNLTAQVNVEMDFTSNQTTEEIFDPESISTRSEQNSQDESTDRPARGIPGAVANQAPLAADLQVDAPETGSAAEFKQRSSSNVKNYEVSKKLSTTVGQIGKIKKVKTAVLVKNKIVELVKNCKIVLHYGSTAQSYAVIFKKPIIYLTSNLIEKNKYVHDNAQRIEFMDQKQVNVDSYEKQILLNKKELFFFNKKIYKEYFKNYLKHSLSKEVPWYVSFTRHFKNK